MVKERVQKKSYQQSLEDIKEKMKERRTKRLANASAPIRRRARMINKSNVGNNAHNILKSIQMNNTSLAVALQAEKEKVRQANAVILQLKRDQQALFFHLLLLKRKLKEHEANVSEKKHPNLLDDPPDHLEFACRKQGSSCFDKPAERKAYPVCAENQSSPGNLDSKMKEEVTLPSTVTVRRRPAERTGQRKSERVKKLLIEGQARAVVGPSIASPITSDDRTSSQPERAAEADCAEHADAEEFQHSTPEHAPLRKNNQRRPSRKENQQQLRSKQEPTGRNPERGRKPEKVSLKKPWENPKPRTRSKSRDRSSTRTKSAAQSQGNKHNASQVFNDTFDFDCEEAVHVTPFKAKVEDSPSATPISEEAPPTDPEPSPPFPQHGETISSTSPSSESDDSLYVPQKSRQSRASTSKSSAITTRRGRISKVITQKENTLPQPEKISIFVDEPSPKTKTRKDHADHHHSAEPSFSNSLAPGQDNHQAHHSEAVVDTDGLPTVSPLLEAEVMRIDCVLSNFGESSGEVPCGPHQTPQRVDKCKKSVHGVRTSGRGLSLCDVTNLSPAAVRKFCSGSRPTNGRSSTPVPTRKRRCTMAVDYTEPSLNAKLRRGDKFTDLQFLRSPVFKQKSKRNSVRTSSSSYDSRKSLKYNEAFVGCGSNLPK